MHNHVPTPNRLPLLLPPTLLLHMDLVRSSSPGPVSPDEMFLLLLLLHYFENSCISDRCMLIGAESSRSLLPTLPVTILVLEGFEWTQDFTHLYKGKNNTFFVPEVKT